MSGEVEHVCWCCAMWGLVIEATRQDQGTDPGWLCGRCADSSPSACNKRHQADPGAVMAVTGA